MRWRRERGVALITALLVVSLATIAVVAMTSRQQVDIRRSANRLQLEQAYQYALGAEAWAMRVLREDRENSQVDHAGEEWATQLPPMAIEGGQVSGYIEALQGRFNLNNLLYGGEADADRFRQLLVVLGLDPELLQAVRDWLDDDVEPRIPGGAEDYQYLGLETPYRAANRAFASTSELLRVAGFDAETYATLAPHVSALPDYTAININIAGVAVLRSLADGLGEAEAEQLIEGRGEEGYASVEAFLNQALLAGKGIPPQGLHVGSDYFMVTAEVSVGRSHLLFNSLLQRQNNGDCRPVWRVQGGAY